MQHILCESPFISSDFYAIQPPHCMAHFGVICFANIGGGGGQNYFHKNSSKTCAHLVCTLRTLASLRRPYWEKESIHRPAPVQENEINPRPRYFSRPKKTPKHTLSAGNSADHGRLERLFVYLLASIKTEMVACRVLWRRHQEKEYSDMWVCHAWVCRVWLQHSANET